MPAKKSPKRRTQVKDLRKREKELSKEELKDVQGGHTVSGRPVTVIGPSGTSGTGIVMDITTDKNSSGIVIVPKK